MSSSDDDDDDLKRAIAMSLQDHANGPPLTLQQAIELDSETEDDDEAFHTENKSQPDVPPTIARGSQNDVEAATGGIAEKLAGSEGCEPTWSLSFLGMDRKKMEQERLARKRKPSVSPPPPRKIAKPSPNPSIETNEFQLGSSKSSGPLIFPRGTVKKTWAFGYPRTGDDIKLEEVLQKQDLNLAVLSSFQWDIEWLLAKLNTRSTHVTLVMQAKDEATKQQYRRETASMSNLRLCFPSMDGQVNCMHSKLMLLSHPGYLRVAVPTANLVTYDWGESGEMENMVFLIDLPRLPGSQRTTKDNLTFFGRELIYFLEAMGLERSIIESVYNFDFTATKDIAFVHTIGGTHSGEGDPWRRTGYCGLGRAIDELHFATNEALHIDFVTSSVGSLNIDFLASLYLAARGDDGFMEYQRRNPATGKARSKAGTLVTKQASANQKKLEDEVRENFHIYFPTHDNVKNSKAGFAGTIYFQSKWYNSPAFPRQALRDCKSTRAGLLMHNKILYARSKTNSPASQSASHNIEWAYIGSANCSESAWGKLTKDRTLKSPKLNCRNWECGVIIPLREHASSADQLDLRQFESIVPVPMQYPGETYGSRKPWFYSEQ